MINYITKEKIKVTILEKNKDIINTALKFSQARLSPPTFGQLAAMEALNTKKQYFKKVIKE